MSWDKVPVDLSDLRVFAKLPQNDKERSISFRQAAREAQYLALKEDPRVFLFGEGIDDPAGVFGTTVDLHKEFGSERVFDTPICENTLTGVAMGAALAGMRPVLIHMRTDFTIISLDQIFNHLAKWKYMFNGKVSVPVVIRAIIGGGWGSAAQHSQPIQALFTHIPGLKVVMPATAYDERGLFLSSILDGSPVIFIEHRWLYDYKDTVPEGPYRVPIGKAVLRKEGKDVTLIASSFMVAIAMEAVKRLEKEGIDAELIDLRTIKPLDRELIVRSAKKTGRAAVLDFGYKFCGVSAEVSAVLHENAFSSLKKPVLRIALADVPTPASYVLEKVFYPNVEGVLAQIKELLAK